MSEAYEELVDMEAEGVEREQPAKFDLAQAIGHPNIAHDLDASLLTQIGAKVVEEYKIDRDSRKEEGYEERIETALKLAKLAKEAKSYPWPNASNVKYPLIIQAAVQFNARSYPAIVDGMSVAKGKVLGRPDPEKRSRADRIGRHMSYQLLEEMEEWEEDTDQLLLRLAIVGTLVRKVYFDPLKGRNCSHVVGPDEFVVNYRAKRDLRVVPRATHILSFYPHEILEKQRSGLWLDVDLGRPIGNDSDDQAPHRFLEQHRLWDLDGDGYPEPYVVTVHEETERVVRIVARFYETGIEMNEAGEVVSITPYQCFAKYGFIPSPDGSFYDIGFGTLLGPLSETINSTINQLMDAGHLANVQGGFIGEGVSIKSGNSRFAPGEWKKTSGTGASLRDNIVPLPTKEPSSVLFSLLTFLIDAAKELTATQEIMTGDTGKANMPVGTTLALIEQGLKTFTAIVKRIHRALKQELGIIYELNARYLPPEVYFTFQDDEQVTGLEDYALDDIDVVPVSDPSMATDMQRMGRAQFLMSMKGQGLNDMAINERVLEAAGIPDYQELLPPEDAKPPPDPKMLEVQAKALLEERKVDIQEGEAAAEIAHRNAETERLRMETAMMGPEAMAFAENLAREAVRQALMMVSNGGSPQMGPGGDGGMAGPSPNAAVPPVPPGPALGPDGAMGLDAGGDGPFPPDEGAPDGGAGLAGLA